MRWVAELWTPDGRRLAEVAETEIGWYVRPWVIGWLGQVRLDTGQTRVPQFAYATTLKAVEAAVVTEFERRYGYLPSAVRTWTWLEQIGRDDDDAGPEQDED